MDHLVEHYRRSHRDLPWRRTRDPYAIVVSEVMLQQTRVETALPYYLRFLERFPDWESLARAEEEEVLALWSGLGYYRRARYLQACAREVLRRGGVPRDPAELAELPGIGEYTAAAVASIAFGVPALALDGNTSRVLLRYFGRQEDPRRAATRRELRRRTRIPEGAAGDFTQALMELGALVCTPTSPRCPECPLRGGCAARAEGIAERIPPRRPARAPVLVERALALAEEDGRVLLVRDQRPGMLEGLWDLPGVDLAEGVDPEQILRRRLAGFGEPRIEAFLGEVRHAITFRRFRCRVYRVHLAADRTAEEDGRHAWVAREELGAWPLTAPARRVLGLATTKPL